MVGQAIGPVLGGVLTQRFGFQSIFVFLLILDVVVIAIIVFVLPETLRILAGDGTIRMTGFHRPLIYKLGRPPNYWNKDNATGEKCPFKWRLVLEPFKFLFEKDVITVLAFGAVVYTVWSMLTSSTTLLFKQLYHLNELLIGCSYLPNGR